jgi:hypothetical protein
MNATPLEIPPGFVLREEAHKAAYENGFRIALGVQEGWLGYRSTTARGDIWIARAEDQGSWLLSITHAGIAAEFEMPAIAGIASPGFAIYAFASLQQLYQTLERVYKLGVSLPDAPLESFKKATAHLPRTTEAERMTVQRVGQSLFRDALLEYWNGRCPLTGITDTALLRASHIVPWAECETDDVHNGLLLSALWDAAFDCGLISFADDGTVLRSAALTAPAAEALDLDAAPSLSPLTDLHRQNLARHRTRHGFLETRESSK